MSRQHHWKYIDRLVLKRSIFAILLGITAALPASAQDKADSEFERKTYEYVYEHPEFLLDYPELIQRAGELARQREDKKRVEKRLQTLQTNHNVIYDTAFHALEGQPGATTTMLVFNDYQCPPCRLAELHLKTILERNPQVNILHLQLPVYGDMSEVAARSVLAANSQGRFIEYHHSLMAAPLPLTLQRILELAYESALDTEELQSRMHDSDIRLHLRLVREIAEELDIHGTPAFVVNGHLLQGGIDGDRLSRFVATAVAGSVEN